ncbi:MAG TPA: trimethylamine methyltransferase family protein [Anaerolineae bacterium]
MNSGFKSQVVPNYRLLTEEQIREIHLASLDILESVGVRVNHDEAVEMLRAAGCRVKADNVVQIPGWLVDACIRSAPSRITIYNRRGEEAMRLEGRKIHYGLGTDLIQTRDVQTGELRKSTLEDVKNAARVVDYCSDIDFVASYALPNEAQTNMMYIECFRAELENTVKPIFFTAAGGEDLAAMIEIAEAVAGGEEALAEKPFLINYSEPTPPLTHSFGAVSKLLLCADKGVPICYTPADVMGASAPVSIAGGIVQANAEALSGIVIHQLRRKGSPIISGFFATPMDMLSSVFVYGGPEFRLTHSAYADLYHYYGIPCWGTAGVSDAHAIDQQTAFEAALTLLMAALDGANLIHDVGYMGAGLIGSPASIVMSNEIIGWVKRMLRGFELTPELMGLDVIRAVGPGGNYLAEEHTLNYYKTELWRPKLSNRDDPDTWEQKGARTFGDRLTEETLAILESHTPESLPADVVAKIDAIVARAEETFKEMYFIA